MNEWRREFEKETNVYYFPLFNVYYKIVEALKIKTFVR